ncbi:MAG: excinuclease ABC subunit UvrA [Verrucomicrobiae bacterium]|nr:excinuclease ABC subunit UvrA [Verrucomicrobiae bacterium]
MPRPSKKKTSPTALERVKTSPKSKRAKTAETLPDDTIQLRGVRQNNLKGFDLDIPLGELTVVTGPSGSGKSSLAFQTLYAEGQRRYVETFSPYTRQFFDRMDKPQVDAIHGIPPAIAIEQSNAVKTTRSTVGTITEINDYLKLLFPRVCKGYDPVTGAEVEPDTPASILRKSRERFGDDDPLLVVFGVPAPKDMGVEEFFGFLQEQGYLRIFVFGKPYRVDDPTGYDRKALPAMVDVIQDRVAAARASRFQEAVERALDLGKGRMAVVEPNSGDRAEFSRGWHSPDSDTELRPPVPNLFSFNHPLGACPHCRGFGRVIGIDIDRALPDQSLSIGEGVVKAFQGDTYSECQDDLERCARTRGVPIFTPFEDLPKEDQEWVIEGEGGDPEEAWQHGTWYGVRGFFDWQESRAYKMHVRVFLSRYRSYTTCGHCKGGRLQPEALCYRVEGMTLPELWKFSIDELAEFFEGIEIAEGDKTGSLLLGEIQSRLSFLQQVGLGYLDLDRPTRTLSGGETERVNLTTCLGASLTNTLFVLDEPTVGLHPRDVSRLVDVMHRLRDLGNTLIVVEHEEAVIRAADHLVDIGPGRGESGGEVVYDGPAKKLKGARSLTHAYLSGKKTIEVPEKRREPKRWLKIERAAQHNLKKIDIEIPLGVFCCITGVSGSGKSTLVHSVLYENLIRQFGESSENEPGRVRAIHGGDQVREVVMVDQSPLARTPRSTPAVYTGVFEEIRKLFTETPDGKSRGLTPGYFSFNSGAGRCERCWGNGFEKVEMQFLSDLYVTCPECEGKRYTPEAMEVELEGKSIHDILAMTVTEAIEFFFAIDDRKARKTVDALQVLADVGLGYLRLGQPLNTLSGGESQRLKLVGHLLQNPVRGKGKTATSAKRGPLLIFDEPTTGLHFDDIAMLLKVFQRLVENGSSLIVIEHNIDVIRCADWIVDLGPEAGMHGGEVVATGTPEQVAEVAESHTGRFLSDQLSVTSNPSSVISDQSLRVAETPTTEYRLPITDHTPGIPNAISLRGAREHNLKNISLDIPRNEFVVVTGLSGSGKSTLAFDILFAEGQRRFLDSMSTYARQFVEQLERPDIDRVAGLPPTVAIEQRISRGGGKSTVATVTEVWQFLRLLYAKVGIQHSPDSGQPVTKQSVTAIVSRLRDAAKSATASKPVKILAPLVKARKGFHTEVAQWAERQGFEMLFVDGQFKAVEGFQKLERFKEHTIDVIVGEISKSTKPDEVRELAELALRIGKQTAKYLDGKNKLRIVSTEMCDPVTGRAFEELDPRMFSYNSPHGWCPSCRGYGTVERKPPASDDKHAESQLDAELREEYRRSRAAEDGEDTTLIPCPTCDGARLNEVALHVKVKDRGIAELARMTVTEARDAVADFDFQGDDALIARDILPEITQRLKFMEEVGLGYLQLDRSATTLSGGESQRIRLAAQLGSNLRGVLYILDEPTIGLHARDNDRLLDTLTALRDKGNSLVVVEHDEDTMRRSDHLIDLGPGAGMFGGEIVFEGPPDLIFGNGNSAKKPKRKASGVSPTQNAYEKPIAHPMREVRRAIPAKNSKDGWLRLKGAKANNLKNIDVRLPIGRLTVIAGISGSGKSSLMRGVLKPAIDAELKKAKAGKRKNPKNPVNPVSERAWKSLTGAEAIEAVYEVDQSPIGKTSRSTPATYVKVFDEIRKLFAQLPDARARGYTASRFSFNTEGGRCETCKGNGQIKMEMAFLPTSYVPCDDCRGLRYNAPTLEVEYNGKNIGEIMNLTIEEAAEFFSGHPKIHRTLSLLNDTGLGYLKLGQPSPTLSGGEAQRIKLVTELTRGIGRATNARLRQNRAPKSNLYLIEEPSIGLHLSDVRRLLEVLHRLVDDGHTVIVIEHNLDIIAEADHVLDIGPEAGAEGGEIVAEGTPEEVAKVKASRTAPFLAKVLQ